MYIMIQFDIEIVLFFYKLLGGLKMRLNVVFSFQSLKLPINYNHILQAFILQLIDDVKFRSFFTQPGIYFQK